MGARPVTETDQALRTTDQVTFAAVIAGQAKYNGDTFLTVSGTTRALSASDHGKVLLCTNGSAVTVTVSAGLPSYFWCAIVQMGAGTVTLDNDAGGTTLNTALSAAETSAQYAGISLANYGTANTYLVT